MVFTDPKKTLDLTLYVDGDKYRVEHPYGIFLLRKDEKKLFMLMPQNKLVLTLPYTEKELDKYKDLVQESQTKYLGPETVEGVACAKYQVTSDKGELSYLWTDVAKRVPVKWMTTDGKKTALWKNYVIGPPNPQLFEVPSDYISMSMPGSGGQ